MKLKISYHLETATSRKVLTDIWMVAIKDIFLLWVCQIGKLSVQNVGQGGPSSPHVKLMYHSPEAVVYITTACNISIELHT